jgi:hypothetical protein
MLSSDLPLAAAPRLLRLLCLLHPERDALSELQAAGVSTERILSLYPVQAEAFSASEFRLLTADKAVQGALNLYSDLNFIASLPNKEWVKHYAVLEAWGSSAAVTTSQLVDHATGSTLLMVVLFLQGLHEGRFHANTGSSPLTASEIWTEKTLQAEAEQLLRAADATAEILEEILLRGGTLVA